MSGLIKYSKSPQYIHNINGLGRHLDDGFQIVACAHEIINCEGDTRKFNFFKTLTKYAFRRYH